VPDAQVTGAPAAMLARWLLSRVAGFWSAMITAGLRRRGIQLQQVLKLCAVAAVNKMLTIIVRCERR
jgi:hypothetical protein